MSDLDSVLNDPEHLSRERDRFLFWCHGGEFPPTFEEYVAYSKVFVMVWNKRIPNGPLPYRLHMGNVRAIYDAIMPIPTVEGAILV